MKTVLKIKIDQKGYLCMCIIDNEFPQNDSEVNLSLYRKIIPASCLKLRRFYKIVNIKKDVIKHHELDSRCREKISEYLNGIYCDLEKSGISVVTSDSKIVYKNVIQSQKINRDSCRLFCFN